MTKVFCKCFIGCVIALLFGALLLCFEATTFLLPFTTVLMFVSGIGIVIFGILWLFAKEGLL